MRNYLAAECYKVFHRKYFYLSLLVVLALEGLIVWGSWFTWSNGNTGMDFYSAAITMVMLLSIGLYATILTGDMVFSEQYKYNTLKNEVAFGVPRWRIYLGKLTVATLVALVAAVVMTVFGGHPGGAGCRRGDDRVLHWRLLAAAAPQRK